MKDESKPKTLKETLIDYTDFSYLEFTKKAEGKKLGYFSFKRLSSSNKTILNSISNEYYEKIKDYFIKDEKDKIVEKMKYIDENFTPYLDYEILKISRDDKTGFYAIALKKDDEIIISYKGSDFHNGGNDWVHNILKLPQDYLTDQGQQASNFFKEIADNNQEAKIKIGGHSLGGFLALETVMDNVGYIDRIDKVYAFDAPGFMKEFINNNEEIIKIFLDNNKMFETQMTFISELMDKLQDKSINHVYRDDMWRGLPEAFFVHLIGNFRKLYDFKDEKNKVLFLPGKLKNEKSKKTGNYFTNLAKSIQIKPNSYKDVKTGLTMQVTLNRETLSIDEFLNKVNKNLFWDEEESFIKKIKEIKELDRNPKYLVRGAILKCDKGSHMRRVDLRLCHGVYFKGGPALHIEDCEVGEGKNIKSFGMCSQTNSICEPDILENWLMGYENTYIVKNDKKAKNLFGRYIKNNLLRALTTRSFLVCACGGLIEPVSSGQEYREGNDRDRTLVKKEINEIDKIEKDLYGEEEDYEIDEKDLYIQ